MITINSEKELVRIETWEDVETRPGYVTDLDPARVELDAIIGSYILSDDIRCGLASCHQPHKKGYLVSTRDGRETNIGNVCGRNHFGVDFESLRKRFDREVRIKTHREIIEAVQSRVQEYEHRLEDLLDQERGASWIHKWVTSLRTPGKGFPEKARTELARMIRAGSPTIAKERRATDREVEALEAAEGREISRLHFVSEEVGTLQGFQALSNDGDLRSLLIVDVRAGLERLSVVDVGGATEHQLAKEVRWVGELESKFDRAEALISAGRRLLTKRNLSQFSTLLEDEADREALALFIRDLPNGDTA